MNPTQLIEAARGAMVHAHAPYSGYRVGAALLCRDGTVFSGCNVENASYGLTNCAERTALFAAVATGRRDFAALAVASSEQPPPRPCGACRQVLAEFCPPDFPVYVATQGGHETYLLADLLPHGFGVSDG